MTCSPSTSPRGIQAPPGGITFNGGSGNDGLRVVGNGQTVAYSPDMVTNGNGVITVGGSTVVFTARACGLRGSGAHLEPAWRE
ncbi:MAG: hypothetical protein U1F81_15575 [Verrucomicrobiaceae bacterium]